MYRISPVRQERLFQSDFFQIVPGGAEANVAVSLANYEENVEFITALPDNPIGDAMMRSLRSFGVGSANIVRSGNRVGLYFTETGSAMRPSTVVYDREHSSLADCKPTDFDWDEILKDVDWFHTTGITPAVSENAAETLLAALKACRQRQIPVSCDLNYRKKLWKWGKEPVEVMREVTGYVDYLIANEEDCQKCLGISIDTDVHSGSLDVDQYRILGNKVLEEFPYLTSLSVSLRESISADHNRWSGILITRDSSYVSKKYDIADIVDRVGGGDSFGAGLIYGFRHFGSDYDRVINYAIAASALKHTIPGDFNRVSREEVLQLMGGDSSGRIKR